MINFFTNKQNELNSALEIEEWKETSVPHSNQIMIDFVSKNRKAKYKSKSLEIVDEFENLEESKLSQLDYLEISDDKYKIINLFQKIIKFMFDTEKIIYFFNPSFSEIISQKLIKIIKEYCGKCNSFIIGGEAFKLKKLTINQKNICKVIFM